jgi:hypothetical protein
VVKQTPAGVRYRNLGVTHEHVEAALKAFLDLRSQP